MLSKYVFYDVPHKNHKTNILPGKELAADAAGSKQLWPQVFGSLLPLCHLSCQAVAKGPSPRPAPRAVPTAPRPAPSDGQRVPTSPTQPTSPTSAPKRMPPSPVGRSIKTAARPSPDVPRQNLEDGSWEELITERGGSPA